MYSSGDPDGQLRDIANSIRTPTQHRRSIVGVCKRQQGHSEANSCSSCHVCIMAGIVLTPASFWGPVLSFLDLVQHMRHKPCTRCTSQRRRISIAFLCFPLCLSVSVEAGWLCMMKPEAPPPPNSPCSSPFLYRSALSQSLRFLLRLC